MELQDVERIARATLKELGVSVAELTVALVPGQPGQLSIDIRGAHSTAALNINCGRGTTAQWVRQQIFEKYLAQSS